MYKTGYLFFCKVIYRFYCIFFSDLMIFFSSHAFSTCLGVKWGLCNLLTDFFPLGVGNLKRQNILFTSMEICLLIET